LSVAVGWLRMNKRLIKVGDDMYYIIGRMIVSDVEVQGLDHWKQCWKADTVLRNGDSYYFCRDIIIAEYQDL